MDPTSVPLPLTEICQFPEAYTILKSGSQSGGRRKLNKKSVFFVGTFNIFDKKMRFKWLCHCLFYKQKRQRISQLFSFSFCWLCLNPFEYGWILIFLLFYLYFPNRAMPRIWNREGGGLGGQNQNFFYAMRIFQSSRFHELIVGKILIKQNVFASVLPRSWIHRKYLIVVSFSKNLDMYIKNISRSERRFLWNL